MMPLMRFALRLLAISLLFPLLTQCGFKSAPESKAVTGPFDNRGNYIEAWVNQPDKWYKPNTPSKKKKPKTTVAKKDSTPKPEIAVVKPITPRPKPVVVKPRPKPKPKPVKVRHKVKKGDTLSGLARKYGSSISKIKKANNIKGTIIRLGQTLTIPK
jgi:LysM repeat protein|tara:strand:- start:12187 stop:12657 length:471 start_codon:yes stop_codon:yes gene_type:complete